MGDLSLQQDYRLEMEEKQRMDEYSILLEETVQNIRHLGIRGRGRLAYLHSVYREHRNGACRNVPEQKFLTAAFMEARRT